MKINNSLNSLSCNIRKSDSPKFSFQGGYEPELLEPALVKSAERAIERNGGELNFNVPTIGQVKATLYGQANDRSIHIQGGQTLPSGNLGKFSYHIDVDPAEIVSSAFNGGVPGLNEQKIFATNILGKISAQKVKG